MSSSGRELVSRKTRGLVRNLMTGRSGQDLLEIFRKRWISALSNGNVLPSLAHTT
jgi:hypothetical protein